MRGIQQHHTEYQVVYLSIHRQLSGIQDTQAQAPETFE
jgi:hypothetical protein